MVISEQRMMSSWLIGTAHAQFNNQNRNMLLAWDVDRHFMTVQWLHQVNHPLFPLEVSLLRAHSRYLTRFAPFRNFKFVWRGL